ncbi:MAG: VRR-NUC domain-containing protein [Hyphomicrobiales bacterium]|nr:VRR-NUC domain-containing protein [Hyphomicrobiales bacterium]
MLASGIRISNSAPLPAVQGVSGDLERAQRPRDLNREARNQVSIVEWIRVVAPDVLVFHVPNGGLRSKAEAARMRWTGVVAGIPDLIVVAPGGRAFFLEVKALGASLSEAQRAIHECLVALGTPPVIVCSIDDARRAFAAWGIDTREARPRGRNDDVPF